MLFNVSFGIVVGGYRRMATVHFRLIELFLILRMISQVCKTCGSRFRWSVIRLIRKKLMFTQGKGDKDREQATKVYTNYSKRYVKTMKTSAVAKLNVSKFRKQSS